jgi:G:T-mismatch repair DNA endonuclease (very short patch repair protein)
MLLRLKDPEVQARRLAGLRTAMKMLHADPQYTRRRMLAVGRRFNRPERKVDTAIRTHNLPFRWTGDGSFIVGRLNPDFMSLDNTRAIEVFGDYWHRLNDRPTRSEDGRREALRSEGVDLLVLWEHEIKGATLDQLAERIRAFAPGGV